MAFLRRGYVPHHYEGPPRIILTGLDGSVAVIDVTRIQCFEEHSIQEALRPFTTVYHGTRQTTVSEDFDTVLARLGEKAVANG